MRGLDNWITRQPDDGHRLEKCDWCGGKGWRNVTSHCNWMTVDFEAECDECGGSGQIEIGPDGYSRAPETTSDRYFRRNERLAAAISQVQTIVDATIRNAGLQSYPWATAKVALTRILLELEGRVGTTDPVLDPLRAYIAAGDGRVQ